MWTKEQLGIAVGLVLKPASRGPLERVLEVVGVVVGIVLKPESRVPHEWVREGFGVWRGVLSKFLGNRRFPSWILRPRLVPSRGRCTNRRSLRL